MEALARCKSRKLYSWWWDSHVSPNNSKWLHQNLAGQLPVPFSFRYCSYSFDLDADMDCKVKSMIRLIEEDGDTFATRAESYFKKRPELMGLVEEFYKAYRALAERYDTANVELRQAHRSVAQASVIDDDDHTTLDLCRFENHSSPQVAVLEKLTKQIQSKKEDLAAKFHQDLQSLFLFELELNENGCLGEKESRPEAELSVIRETLNKLEAQALSENVSPCISILKDAISVSDHRTNGNQEADQNRASEMGSRRAEIEVLMEIIAQKDRELLRKEDDLKTLQIKSVTSHDEEKLNSLLLENDKLEKELASQVSQNTLLEQKLCAMTRKYRDEKWTLRTVCEEKNELYERLQSMEKELNDTVEELGEKIKGLVRENSRLLSETKKTKERMSNMEEVYLVLKEEKKCLVNERNSLLDEMQSVGFRMGNLETRFSKMEEKCSAFEISLFHEFMRELEMKNTSLALECQKHHESSQRTRKILAEFEAENLEQLANIQLLMAEIEFLRVNSNEEKLLLQIENMILVAFLNQTHMQPMNSIEESCQKENIEDEGSSAASSEIQVSEKAVIASQTIHHLPPEKNSFESDNTLLGRKRSSRMWRDDFVLEETESQRGMEQKLKDIQLDQVSEYASSRYSHMFEEWAHEIAQVSRRNSTALLRNRSRRNHSRASKHRNKSSIVEFQFERESDDERTIGRDVHDNMILERLESDAKRLIEAELIVQELMEKLEVKRSGKKANTDVIEGFKKQLTSMEEQILLLFGSTNQLARDVETIQTYTTESVRSSERSLIAERAIKGSEVVGCLHFEVENLQYNVLKSIDGKKKEGKSKIPGRGILLKHFISSRDTDRKKRNKFLCGLQNNPSMKSSL